MATLNQIEEVLKSLDGSKRAEPGPFFTGRVLHKLHEPMRTEVPVRASVRWMAVITMVLILIAMNFVVYFTQFRSTESVVNEWRSGTPAWVVDFTQNPVGSVYDVPSK